MTILPHRCMASLCTAGDNRQMKKVILASGNAGKLRELQALLAPLGLEIMAQSALNIPEASEPHHTFIENALEKARHASRLGHLPALADDSGLCVHALDGAPGVYSAHYAGEPRSDTRNNQKLVAALQGMVPRTAFYYCALVFVESADDPRPLIAEGAWDGEIIDTPRGTGGFGYDPHFFLPTHHCTAAELDPAQKNIESHRGKAIAALATRLRARLGRA